MTAKQTAAVAVMALALAGCASQEERVRAASVRVVKDADVVRGCQPIGSVTDDDIQDLQKKAARLGGDVPLVTLQSQRGGGSGPAYSFGSSTYTTAEVYRCGSGR
jgi:outer membrane lipoprotein SlyB